MHVSKVNCTSSIYIAVPFPPPSHIRLIDINQLQLVFAWNPHTSNCASIVYAVTSDCGVCPSTTIHNTVTCSRSSTDDHVRCTFAVQTVVCGNVVGERSRLVTIQLTGTCRCTRDAYNIACFHHFIFPQCQMLQQ